MLNLHSTVEIDWSNFNSTLVIEVTRPSGVFTCSGIAINPFTVLTAAHCLDGDILNIRISNASHYDPNESFCDVENFELHPDYQPEKSLFRNDLAKIKLKNHLPSSVRFFPISKKNDIKECNVLRLGYGERNNKNDRTLISPLFKDLRKNENVLELHDTYSYSGDSGGPVFIQQNGQWHLVAIHSTLSFGPEGKYSFNPILLPHRKWIEAPYLS